MEIARHQRQGLAAEPGKVAAGANQAFDLHPLGQQPVHQIAADEAAGPCYQSTHEIYPIGWEVGPLTGTRPLKARLL